MNVFTEWNSYIENKIPEDELAHIESLTRHINTFFYEIQKKHELELSMLEGRTVSALDMYNTEREISNKLMARLSCIDNKENFFVDTDETITSGELI